MDIHKILHHSRKYLTFHKVFFIAVVLSALLYKPEIEKLLYKILIKFHLNKAIETLFTDIFFFTIVGIIVLVTTIVFNRFTISWRMFLWGTLLATIYMYYRFFSDAFIFNKLTLLPDIAYLDAFIVLFLCLATLKISLQFKRRFNDEDLAFIPDSPIEEDDEDLLNCSEQAAEIAERIENNDNKHAIAVGINGQWGSGKTSYMNLIKNNLTSNVIVIDFTPWSSLNDETIVTDFFNTLSNNLRRYSPEFNKIARQYSQSLTGEKKGIFDILFSNFFITEYPIDEARLRLNKIIQELKCPIAIFIDDLDRLSREEILEVLKLVRSTADFNLVTYIVAYDKYHIKTQLGSAAFEYLEKIFQIEEPLPFIEGEPIAQILHNILWERYDEDMRANGISNLADFRRKISVHWLKNIRDIKRLLNFFIFNYDKMKEEVSFEDFLHLTLLKIKFPIIYEDLFYKAGRYLEIGNDSQYVYYIARNSSEIETYLRDNNNRLGIRNEDIKTIAKFIDLLFAKHNPLKRSDALSIVHTNLFKRYFTKSLLISDLSEAEFQLGLKLKYNTFKRLVTAWLKIGKSHSLKLRLRKFVNSSDYKNKDEFEKIIKIIFFIAGYADKNRRLEGYSEEDFYTKIYSNPLTITKNFYEGDYSKYQEFILSVFRDAKFPFYTQADILKYVITHDASERLFKQDELKNILFSYFIKFKRQYTPSFDNFDIYKLYWANKMVNNNIDEEFIKYLDEGFLNYFLVHNINDEFSDNQIPCYAVSRKTILSIFGDWTNFINYLREKNPSPEITEYLTFIELWLKNEENYTEFKFSTLPVTARFQ